MNRAIMAITTDHRRETASSLEPSIRAAAELHLALMEYEYVINSDGDDIRFQVGTVSGPRWNAQLLIYEKERVARFFIHLDFPYHPSRKDWITTLVNEANNRIAVFGTFCVNEGGGISYHTGQVIDPDFTKQEIKRLMDQSAWPVACFESALRHINTTGVLPRDAVNAALIERDALGDTRFDNGTRRALISLMK